MSSWLYTRVETVVVSARVTGQRVELSHRDFSGGQAGGGVLSPEVVRDVLAKNAHTPVVVLVLRSCKLAALPRELGQLTFLHELDVSDNLLTDLPIELVALTNLAKLTLSGNKFKELPVFIGHLPGLLHLQVLGMPTLTTPHNLLRHGTEAICAYLRSSFVTLEEKQGELELHVRETFNVAKHADICFVVDGEPIHAHRLIIGLRIASPIFESFLASPNKEHKIEGVGAETFVRLLRFAYGNGLYDPLKSPLENRAFLAMLDTLQITTFGRNHRLVGTGMIIKRTDAMLRDDFIRLFHTANRISYTPTTTAAASTCDVDEPPSPAPPTPTDQASEPKPPQPAEAQPASDLKPVQPPPETQQGTTKRRGKQKRETRAEREMRVFAEAQARRAATERQRELEAQAERDKAERQARVRSEQAQADELAKKAQVERERQAAAATAETAAAAARAASGLLPPGTLLNEAFLRRHGWFADLRVRCASDVRGGGGGESEEDEEEEAQVENETGHGVFVCHKFLLCVRSPYFQAKFEGGMSDALDKEIVIDEFERDPISQMLRFLYTDELTVNSDNAQDLLELSGHYQLERLRSVVEKFFGDNIDHDNVLSLLHLADHYQAYHLKVFCTSYIFKHQSAITSCAEWGEWRKEHPELYSQLLRLLQ